VSSEELIIHDDFYGQLALTLWWLSTATIVCKGKMSVGEN